MAGQTRKERRRWERMMLHPKKKWPLPKPEEQEALLHFLKQGARLKIAAQAAGLDWQQVKYWMEQGQAGTSSVLHAFAKKVLQVRAQGETETLATLRSIGFAELRTSTQTTTQDLSQPEHKISVSEAQHRGQNLRALERLLDRCYAKDLEEELLPSRQERLLELHRLRQQKRLNAYEMCLLLEAEGFQLPMTLWLEAQQELRQASPDLPEVKFTVQTEPSPLPPLPARPQVPPANSS